MKEDVKLEYKSLLNKELTCIQASEVLSAIKEGLKYKIIQISEINGSVYVQILNHDTTLWYSIKCFDYKSVLRNIKIDSIL